ncbi:hypothetical protein D3C86_734620 [compost metagenome]
MDDGIPIQFDVSGSRGWMGRVGKDQTIKLATAIDGQVAISNDQHHGGCLSTNIGPWAAIPIDNDKPGCRRPQTIAIADDLVGP